MRGYYSTRGQELFCYPHPRRGASVCDKYRPPCPAAALRGCGVLCMGKMLKGKVPIFGVDKAPNLIKAAEKRRAETQDYIRNQLRFCVGDMMEPPAPLQSSGQPISPRLVTILGTSFSYLNSRERKTALKNIRAWMAPGAKLVIQFRDDDPNQSEAQRAHTVEMQARSQFKLMRTAKEYRRGQVRTVMHDDEKHDASYFYDAACLKPDKEHMESYTQRDVEGLRRFVDQDGIEYRSFGRAYIDKTGEEHDLGSTMVDSLLTVQSFDIAKKILEDAGFNNVQLKIDDQRLGKKISCAFVATNPIEGSVQ